MSFTTPVTPHHLTERVLKNLFINRSSLIDWFSSASFSLGLWLTDAMAVDLGSPRREGAELLCPCWALSRAWSCPAQTLPYRALTGQPSGKWSGVQRRKSGQPRSLSTMAQGPRVAWQRVRLGSSTRLFSHFGMYTAHSRGWITAQQRGAFRRPGGSDSVDTLQ